VEKFKYVYEYDYRSFFDKLEITYITGVLAKLGVPKYYRELIENLNKSQPKLTKEDKIDEFKVRQFEYISDCLAREMSPSGPYWEPIRQGIIEAFGSDDPTRNELLMECLQEGVGTYYEQSDIRDRPQMVLLKYVEVQ
jgi:hypothetical protein